MRALHSCQTFSLSSLDCLSDTERDLKFGSRRLPTVTVSIDWSPAIHRAQANIDPRQHVVDRGRGRNSSINRLIAFCYATEPPRVTNVQRMTSGPTTARGISRMPDEKDKTLDKIEETQAALRESIEEAKALAEESERLVKKHRKEVDKGS